jgi:prepilin-type N-terminal cleavage/methylation domain-containing protein
MSPDRGRQRGFTLLEVLVALAIMALAMAALADGAATGLGGSHGAGKTLEALSHARSHLAALEAGGLVPGTTEAGDGGGFHTSVQVVPVMPGLDDVLVTVSWSDGGVRRSVTLATRRAAGAP